MQKGDLVFVYGSLRAGLGNHGVVATAPREKDGRILDQFRMVSLYGFPGLIKESPTPIVVEVYEVDSQERQRRLDSLEGYPTFYNREIVELEDGRKGWVYYLPADEYNCNPPVPNGDWFEFLKGK